MPKKSEARGRRTGDYEVGYGRPPKNRQWKKGDSGNPGGRRQPKSSSEIFRKMMDRKIRLPRDGREVTFTRLEALYEKMYVDAMKGRASAQKHLLARWEKIEAERARDRKTVIHAQLILEDDPPLWVREAVKALEAAQETRGEEASRHSADALQVLRQYVAAYFPNSRPRP